MIRALALVLLLASTANAADAETCARMKRRYERECSIPVPTPVPTRTPSPTAVVDCSDGAFSLDAAGKVLSRENRTYEPGRVYNLCMTVPTSATAPAGILRLDSVNHANASCNIHHVWLTSPSGATSTTSGPAPGLNVKFERGKWGVLVMLDANDARCATNPGLSMWATWF